MYKYKCIVRRLECTGVTVLDKVYIDNCTLYRVQVTWCSVQCSIRNILCTLHTSLYTVQLWVNCNTVLQWTVDNLQCTLYIVQCTLYSVQCTVSSEKFNPTCKEYYSTV